MKNKQQTPVHNVNTVSGLQAILERYPPDARIYSTYEGDVIVYRGKEELAKINLKGY